MKKLAAAFVLILGMACSGSAFADDWWYPTPVHRAPEIDPAGAIAGLTLLAGGLAILRARRRSK